MINHLEIFRKDYLNANTWQQRKEGVPLDLLDNLAADEIVIAETELISSVSLRDSWPIIGLGHIKSTKSLPKLYELLPQSSSSMKVAIAHSIFQICGDKEMVPVALEETRKITEWYELTDILYMLPDFKDGEVTQMIHEFYDSKSYLVACNAARVLGLPTEHILEKFRKEQ